VNNQAAIHAARKNPSVLEITVDPDSAQGQPDIPAVNDRAIYQQDP